MGKTTLYHPISLNVIRGSAEYGGFKLVRIKQLGADRDRRRARYYARIEGFPGGWDHQPTSQMQHQLQECFMDDIQIQWLHQGHDDCWLCHIWIDLEKEAGTLEGGELA